MISNSNEALKPVWEFCKKYSMTKTQLALSYVLSYPGVSTIIPGIRTPEHVMQNTTGLTRLDDADMKNDRRPGKSRFCARDEVDTETRLRKSNQSFLNSLDSFSFSQYVAISKTGGPNFPPTNIMRKGSCNSPGFISCIIASFLKPSSMNADSQDQLP